MTAAAVLLAAGAGTRFSGPIPKLLNLLGGRTVIERAVEAAAASALAGPYVVFGELDLGAVLGDSVRLVPNPAWQSGIATSLSAGIRAADHDGHDAVVLALADQPDITPESWRAVAACDSTPVAVATYAGRRGHPVRLGREIWAELPSTGDRGASVLISGRPELVTEVPCTSGSPDDIDTVEDLDRFSSRTASE